MNYSSVSPQLRNAPSEAELVNKWLGVRAGRLQKLVELNAPKVILANEVYLILKAGFQLCPAEMSKVMQKAFLHSFRKDANLCMNCGSALQTTADICTECETEFKEMLQREEENWQL